MSYWTQTFFTCQFSWLLVTELFSQCLDFFFINCSFFGFHEINLSWLLKDLLGHFKRLIQVSLDECVSQLLPVGCLENKLLELLFIFIFDSLTTFLLMLFKTLLCLQEGVFDNNFAGLQEIVESHRSILLVLSLSKSFSISDKFFDDFFRWLGFFKFRLLLRFFLRHNYLSKWF